MSLLGLFFPPSLSVRAAAKDLSLPVKSSDSQRQDWRLTDEEIIPQVLWVCRSSSPRGPLTHFLQNDYAGRTRDYGENGRTFTLEWPFRPQLSRVFQLTLGLWELAKHPDCQEKLRAEINKTLEKVKARGDANFTPNDFENMPYLVAVIKVRRDR